MKSGKPIPKTPRPSYGKPGPVGPNPIKELTKSSKQRVTPALNKLQARKEALKRFRPSK